MVSEAEAAVTPNVDKPTLKSTLDMYFGEAVQPAQDNDEYWAEKIMDLLVMEPEEVLRLAMEPENVAKSIAREAVKMGAFTFKYCPLKETPIAYHNDESCNGEGS